MTTEREYQEGQDRIRRAQGKRQWLRSGKTGASYPRYSSRSKAQRWVPWIIAGIAAISIYGAIKARDSRPTPPSRSAPQGITS
ncbi:MAG: hypothetical protein AAF268_13350 [Cyanobacteria bacterium P01_A01_bin.3]